MCVGPQAVGVFNQIYAVYVIAGQIAVLGLHDSAQKHLAEFADEPKEQDIAALGATLLGVLSGTIGAMALAALSGLFGWAADSVDVGWGVLLASPGLLLFVVSKVLMGILNGKRRMIAFAIGQSMRAISILAACIIVIQLDLSLSYLGLCFTSGELLVVCFLVFVAHPFRWRWGNWSRVRSWVEKHAYFGLRGAVNSTLSETFIRVDILTLAFFLSDRQVGIYSFVALFIEGLYMIPVTIRYLANPVLARLIHLNDQAAVPKFARRVSAFSVMATACISACLLLVFPHLSFLSDEGVIRTGWSLLWILVSGLVVYSSMIPFDYILLQAGRPGSQSLFMLLTTSLNAILNLILIHRLGLYGAAIATSISFVASALLLYCVSSVLLGMKGGVFVNQK